MTKKFSMLFKRIQSLQLKAIGKGIASSINYQVSSSNKALVSYYFVIEGTYHSYQASDNKYLHLDLQLFEQLEQLVINHMNKL